MLLAAGERRTTLSDHGVVPVRKRRDKIMAAGFFRCLHYLLMGGVGRAELDVVFNGIVKEIDVLEHHAHVFQQAVAGELFHIVAAHGNAALLHIPKAGNEPGNGSLSTAGGSHNSSHAPLGDGEAHVFQNLVSIFIGKGYMVEGNVKGSGRYILPIFINFLCRLDALHPVQGGIQHADQRGHLPHDFQRVEDGKRCDQNHGEPGKRKLAAGGQKPGAKHHDAGADAEHHGIAGV